MKATEADFAAHHQLRADAWAVDFPEDPLPTYEGVVAQLRAPEPEYGPCYFWTAHRAGRLVATARVGFPAEPNEQLAMTEIRVHPEFRRLGVGRRLLAATLPTACEQGRSLVGGGGIKDDSPGVPWSTALGFRTTQRITMQRLDVANVKDHIRQESEPAGYRLERWIGHAPTALISSYADARSAIHDAPRSDTSYRQPEWTVGRVREQEEQLRQQDIHQRVVVAVHNQTDHVAGLTIVNFYPPRPNWGYQQDTAVLQQHRGHGLGRFMKVAMLRWLVAERPGLEFIFTTTDADNSHMIRVNHGIGYADIRTMRWVEAPTTDLCARLGVSMGQYARADLPSSATDPL
jgi:GNAT superfamily N-acetyltransferase